MTIRSYRRSHLRTLEDESVHILRELAAERERPCLLFSGGKDSIVLLRLAEKAFRPARFPFPLMHVDTGHNFPETLEYRDRRVAELGERLIVAHVEDSIAKGRVTEETGPRASRNRLQTTTLLDAIEEHQFDAAIGGARRDEEKARAKERIFSHRDEFGQWDPQEPAARAVVAVQRPGPARRAPARVPAVELDRARRLAVHRARVDPAALDLLRAPPRRVRARRHAVRPQQVHDAVAGRAGQDPARAVPDDRRHDVHRGRWRRPPRRSRR